jgi:hypothetical protein
MKSLSITARIWKWPGDMSWHFVTLPREQYEIIRKEYPKSMVHITATVDNTSWNTALFPHTKSKSFILPIKKSIRIKENLFEGEEVKIKLVFINKNTIPKG